MIIRRDVFQAIADPIRRQIIDLVAYQPLNLNAIASEFEVSRQAVSVHVRILTECGLLVVTQKGRERYCEARLEQLNEVSDWVTRYKALWESRFASLDNYLKNTKPQKKSNAKKNGRRK
ncbi:ArsR/SmtB family transcription factor [Niabella drilacis]|uniref:DNA-binding transcriptional regulator, ArsR family n=1 Tax=Niabella drilacis (strain DSM 25811 / CCM 8410 / CCUG 62505 / LMG 26954 / E90) TaxID=1285928 RepID=A0A1G6X3Z9_NIADE|nr:metalloregulator ArsR/SmtB family transcription factor [Niabella drilacis]SDD72035.1 DNA-binding transcriptional regulator, ArsR family [Niabella drilacis]